MTALLGVLAALVLVLAGVGLGAAGATVIGMSRLADLKQPVGAQPPGQRVDAQPSERPSGAGRSGSGSTPRSSGQPSQQMPQPSEQEAQGGKVKAEGAAAPGEAASATLGVEAVDAPTGGGALLVGVHIPGPGHSAGLVRGDVLLAFDRVRVTSAAGLARAVADARPGVAVTLGVRHRSGDTEVLVVTPGVVT